MTPLKLVIWNVNWMEDLFGPDDQPPAFRADKEIPQHITGATVRERRDSLATVLNDLSADIVVMVEGPNRTSELQLFFDEDVDGTWSVQVQHSHRESHQNIGVAVREDQGKFRMPPFFYYDTTNIAAFDPFEVETDDDEIEAVCHFERRPLYVEIRPQVGRNFRILGLHLKSRTLSGAFEWKHGVQQVEANRRKILAQATQLRLSFLDPYLEDEATRDIPLIVCGDINDGPGFDEDRKRRYGSAVERLMGLVWQPDFCLGNALFDGLTPQEQRALDFSSISTARYGDPFFSQVWHHAWVDHVLYTQNTDVPWVTDCTVYDATSNEEPFWQVYPHASDHFPIVVTVTPPNELG